MLVFLARTSGLVKHRLGLTRERVGGRDRGFGLWRCLGTAGTRGGDRRLLLGGLARHNGCNLLGLALQVRLQLRQLDAAVLVGVELGKEVL